MIKSPFDVCLWAIFVFIRVLFCYADNRQELCSRNFMIYEDYAEKNCRGRAAAYGSCL